MKIALLGYGKMGKAIEEVAAKRGHQIVLRKNIDSDFLGLENADVAIDFSSPNAAVENISECLQKNIPIVSGTTGWLTEYEKVINLCKSNQGAFLYGSNFSLGVNIFFELNEHLAKLMSNYNQYQVSLEEIHHTQKLDAPSGTAISLANGIIKNSNYKNWKTENPTPNDILIACQRIDDVPGTHTVFYNSEIDQIEIKHTAHNRQGFALGAVIAAEWLIGKKGVFSMRNVLGFANA